MYIGNVYDVNNLQHTYTTYNKISNSPLAFGGGSCFFVLRGGSLLLSLASLGSGTKYWNISFYPVSFQKLIMQHLPVAVNQHTMHAVKNSFNMKYFKH